MNNNLELLSHILIVFLALFSIIYTFGVVWRVEKKLDISFKLFFNRHYFFHSFRNYSYFSRRRKLLSRNFYYRFQDYFYCFFLNRYFGNALNAPPHGWGNKIIFHFSRNTRLWVFYICQKL